MVALAAPSNGVIDITSQTLDEIAIKFGDRTKRKVEGWSQLKDSNKTEAIENQLYEIYNFFNHW